MYRFQGASVASFQPWQVEYQREYNVDLQREHGYVGEAFYTEGLGGGTLQQPIDYKKHGYTSTRFTAKESGITTETS